MSRLDRELQAIYDRLPVVVCQGKCQDACGPIACSDGERRRMERRAGKPLVFHPETLSCGYLVDGRCSVYRERPFVCRIYGASTKLACPFGCRPQTPPLPEDVEADLLKRVIDLAGPPVASIPLEEA